MKIGYPKLAEQNDIINFLTKEIKCIEKAEAFLVAQIENLQEYKTTLINSAVTGKIKSI
jgi:type I restriction enzyme S subunit